MKEREDGGQGLVCQVYSSPRFFPLFFSSSVGQTLWGVTDSVASTSALRDMGT